MSLFTRFLKDESGATAIEYALIAAIVGLGLIFALTTLTGDIKDAFNGIGNALTTATSDTGG